MERDIIGEAWDDIKPHIEDELRSKAMAKKFNPYRQVAGDKRVWSQIREVQPVICQECGQPIDIRMELIVDGKHEACAKKEQTR
jgi:hypothetical protein